MFWQKKEDKYGLPDLPPVKPAPSPAMHEIEEPEFQEKHTLPAFPDSPMQKGFAQSAIKDAINPESTERDSEFEPPPEAREDERSFKAIEMDSSINSESDIPRLPKKMHLPVFIPESPVMETFQPRVPRIEQKNADIFVKIDKFYSARRSLDSVKENLQDINELLKKIRETRLREEQELISWEKEMANIKARIKEVTENIFEKIE